MRHSSGHILTMLATGTLIDSRYELIEPIGSGGFGTVYKARQLQLDRDVALKLLSTNLLHEGDGLARFEREARLINCLKHRNIVSLYGYGVFQQAPYMVMEFVEGTALSELLQNGAIEPKRTLRIMTQVFEALACAHASGVVHRDLKPANILVDENDQVKIIDFGLAKLMPGYGVPGQKLTDTGYTLGTCHYMAPEQALGQPVDQRADIYAAGCIMYEMLCGEVPFDDEDNVAIMYKHLDDQPKPMSSCIGESPEARAIAAFVANCMVKDNAQRYQSCEDALTALKQIMSGAYSKVVPHVVSIKRGSNRPGAGNARLRLVVALAILVSSLGAALIVSSERFTHLSGSAELYHQFMGTASEKEFYALDRVWRMDRRDHQLTHAERLDLLYRMLTVYPRTSLDVAGVDEYIAELLKERGEIINEVPPPRDCRTYTDGDFSRLLLGWNVNRYLHQAERLAQVGIRQGFGTPDASYTEACIEYFLGSPVRSMEMARKLGTSTEAAFRLTDYIRHRKIKDAVEYCQYLRSNSEERELWLARVGYHSGDFKQAMRHAALAVRATAHDKTNKPQAARYLLAAAKQLGMTANDVDADGKLREIAHTLPVIVPAYPAQIMDQEVWAVFRKM